MADDGEQSENPIGSTGSTETETVQPESEGPKVASSAPAVVSEAPVKEESADKQGTDGSGHEDSDEDSDDSIVDEPIILMDELLNLGTTGIHFKCSKATPPGTNAMAVAVLVPQTFAGRAGVRKGDWVHSVNGKTFTNPEDVCRFVQMCETKETVVNLKIMREINPGTAGSETEEFVASRIYCEPNNLLLDERLVMYDEQPFQGWSTDEYYLRYNKNGFFVTIQDNNLVLRQEMKAIVFKVHTIIESRRDADRPKLVVLEHKKSKSCVTMKRKTLSWKPNLDEQTLSPIDPRVLQVTSEVGKNGGMKYSFKPYNRKRRESFFFLDFEEDGDSWKPVITQRSKPKTAEEEAKLHISNVFTLFKKLE